MRICVTSAGSADDSMLDTRFGRCAYFLLWNTDSGEHSFVLNEGIFVGTGAGVFAYQLMEEKCVNTLITGNIGEESLKMLKAAGIKVYQGENKAVTANIERFQEGQLKQIA